MSGTISARSVTVVIYDGDRVVYQGAVDGFDEAAIDDTGFGITAPMHVDLGLRPGLDLAMKSAFIDAAIYEPLSERRRPERDWKQRERQRPRRSKRR